MMTRIPDEDERDTAPHFTPEQIMYLEKVMLGPNSPQLFTPASVDATVKLLGIIGERKGRQDVVNHLRSLQQSKG